AVRRIARIADQPQFGADVDDAPVPALEHAGERRPEAGPGSAQIDRDRSREVLPCVLMRGYRMEDTGVVDEHVDPTEPLLRLPDEAECLLGLSNIGFHDLSVTAVDTRGGHNFVQGAPVLAKIEREEIAQIGKAARRRQAYPLAGAGNGDNP